MKFTSPYRILTAMLALLLLAAAAWAGETPYSKTQFEAALAQGKPVIVEFSADWCPVCKAQKPIVESLLKQDKLKNVTLFVANYDTETEIKKQLRVTQQSTFVVFKDGKEVGRSTGQTNKDAISSLFDKAL